MKQRSLVMLLAGLVAVMVIGGVGAGIVGWGTPAWGMMGPGTMVPGIMGPGMMRPEVMGPGMMGGFSGAVPASGLSTTLAAVLTTLSGLAFWGAVIVGLILLVRGLSSAATGAPARRTEAAVEVLQRRYAAGEISQDEYEHMLQVLGLQPGTSAYA